MDDVLLWLLFLRKSICFTIVIFEHFCYKDLGLEELWLLIYTQ